MSRKAILKTKDMVYTNSGIRLLGVVEYCDDKDGEEFEKGMCNIVMLSPEQYANVSCGKEITVYPYYPDYERRFPFEVPNDCHKRRFYS